MTRLLLVHGFTQTADSWHRSAYLLQKAGHDVQALDLPGHGTGSGPQRLVKGDLWVGASTVAAQAGRGTWIGYSMGARLALHVAIAHPEVVDRLVLLGGTAGIEDPADRTARRTSDERLARRIESEGVDAFLDGWMSQPLFAGLPEDPIDLAARRTNTPQGLASSLRCWGTGTMDPPLWERLTEITAPTLVLAGVTDRKFTELGRRLAAGIGPTAKFDQLPDAGHAAHLERPDDFSRVVGDWLTQA